MLIKTAIPCVDAKGDSFCDMISHAINKYLQILTRSEVIDNSHPLHIDNGPPCTCTNLPHTAFDCRLSVDFAPAPLDISVSPDPRPGSIPAHFRSTRFCRRNASVVGMQQSPEWVGWIVRPEKSNQSAQTTPTRLFCAHGNCLGNGRQTHWHRYFCAISHHTIWHIPVTEISEHRFYHKCYERQQSVDETHCHFRKAQLSGVRWHKGNNRCGSWKCTAQLIYCNNLWVSSFKNSPELYRKKCAFIGNILRSMVIILCWNQCCLFKSRTRFSSPWNSCDCFVLDRLDLNENNYMNCYHIEFWIAYIALRFGSKSQLCKQIRPQIMRMRSASRQHCKVFVDKRNAYRRCC